MIFCKCLFCLIDAHYYTHPTTKQDLCLRASITHLKGGGMRNLTNLPLKCCRITLFVLNQSGISSPQAILRLICKYPQVWSENVISVTRLFFFTGFRSNEGQNFIQTKQRNVCNKYLLVNYSYITASVTA